MAKSKAKTQPPKSDPSPNPSPAPESADFPVPPSFAAAYARMLPAAELLPEERVVNCRLDVNLVFANVQTGTAAVQPYVTRLLTETPLLHADRFHQLDDLAGALLYAGWQTVANATPMKRELLEQKTARLYTLREQLLLCAELFVLVGIFPKNRVEQIRSGTGLFDAAQDAIALVDLFTEFTAAVQNKHPFTQAQLHEAADLGNTLVRSITPEGARLTTNPALVKAIAARDRLYSVLLERHADLRKAGFYLFGEEVNEKVPLLGARRGRTKAAPTEPESPTPPPAAEAPLS